MDAKENARRIIRFAQPERVVSGPPVHDCSYFGVNHEPFAGAGGHEAAVGTFWRDIWGVGWRKELEGVMGYAVEHPLADLRLDRFAWPSADDPRICSVIPARAAAKPAGVFLCGSHRETLWERAYNLVGMERLLLAMALDTAAVRELFRHIMDFQLGIARHYLAVGIEIAFLGDDLGHQHGLFFSRQTLEELLVPEYLRLIELYKQHDVLVFFHSCGHIEPILEVFMAMGVDVLNPLQATANDLERVRRVTQGKMALQGGVATATVMSGPPAAIRQEVRQRLWQLGRDGGYFCAPDQGMPFPAAHLQAFDEAVRTYGVYPLADISRS